MRTRLFITGLATIGPLIGPGVSAPAAVTDEVPQATAAPVAVDASERVTQLVASSGDAAARTRHAADLVEASRTDRKAATLTVELLLGQNTPEIVRLALLGAIADAPTAPEALWAGVSDLISSESENETLAAALKAMAGYRSREAVGDVIELGKRARDQSPRAALMDAALATLVEQTGRSEPSGDIAEWEAWFKLWASGSRTEWAAEIARLQAERARAVCKRDAELSQRFSDVYRRLLVATPAEQRPALMAEMIRSDIADVRELGFDMATRAVLNAQTPGETVAQAAAERLTDREPAIRASAALLLEKLDSPNVADKVAQALAKEQNSDAAAAMLRVLARSPRGEALRDITAWLDSTGPAFGPAVDAAQALFKHGTISDQDLLARIHELMRAVPPARLTPGCVALLARVGKVDEVSGLLDSTRPEIVLAAGEALASMDGGAVPLVNAARRNPMLFESAVRALSMHHPDAEAFGTAETLPAPFPEKRVEILSAFAGRLAPDQLLVVAARQGDLTLREAYAARSEYPGFFEGHDGATARQDLALLLARTRLALKNPAGALAGLEAACAGGECAWAAPARVCAMAWLNRLDEAAALTKAANVGAGSWLDALEWSIDLEHASRMRDLIRELFSSNLGKDDSARLAAIEARMIQTGPVAPGGSVGTPAPGEKVSRSR